MSSISWKDIAHYGAGLGMILLGVLGEIGVPGINGSVCLGIGVGILGGGFKGGITSGK